MHVAPIGDLRFVVFVCLFCLDAHSILKSIFEKLGLIVLYQSWRYKMYLLSISGFPFSASSVTAILELLCVCQIVSFFYLLFVKNSLFHFIWLSFIIVVLSNHDLLLTFHTLKSQLYFFLLILSY